MRNALELEANVEVFSVDDDDLAVLASVESEQNKKKRDDARKKVAAMSPGSKARALVRPPSRQEAKRKGVALEEARGGAGDGRSDRDESNASAR